jgi:hypothetical protein
MAFLPHVDLIKLEYMYLRSFGGHVENDLLSKTQRFLLLQIYVTA